MDIKEDIKILMVKENITLVDLARKLSLKYNKKFTADGLSKKLRNGTMQYNEAMKIFEVLGYEIVLNKVGNK